MLRLMRKIFARATLEERRAMDLLEAEITLLEASKQVEYYEALTRCMQKRIVRLQQQQQ